MMIKKNYRVFLLTVCCYFIPGFLVQSETLPADAHTVINSIEYRQIKTMAQVTIIADTGMTRAGYNWYKVETEHGYKLHIDIFNASINEKTLQDIIEPDDYWLREIRCSKKDEGVVRVAMDVIKPLDFRIFKESKKLYITFIPLLSPEEEEMDEQKKDVAIPEEDTITIRLENADIRKVLKLFAEVAGFDIILKDDVSGEITAHFTNVPVSEAMEYILDSKDLVCEKKGNIIKIRKGLSSELKQKLKIDTISRSYKLKYAKAAMLNTILTNFLTEYGSTIVDDRTNTLIVKEVPENIDKIDAVILQLDSKTPQVMIEAKILDVTLTDDNDMGVDWNQILPAASKHLTLNVNFGFGTFSSQGLNAGLIDEHIDVLVTALQSSRKVEILSSPKLVTLDNQQATLEVGDEVPIRTAETVVTGQATTQTTSYNYRNVLLKLDVTPQIQENLVFLDIQPEVNFVNGYSADEMPIIGTRRTKTQVLVKDGQTLVMGGLIRTNNIKHIMKVPFLSNVPLLGKLFQKTTVSKSKTELIILITVHILNNSTIKTIADKYKPYENIMNENKELLQ
ncbi:MAG: secretin N-terminal domain-containing protein [Candidatus Hydrogenedentota bacterium]